MDIKIEGLDFHIISEALEKAKRARLHILDIMEQVIPQPREQLSKYAPRIITIQIPPDKIGDLIGPKGQDHPGHPGADRRRDQRRRLGDGDDLRRWARAASGRATSSPG